MEQFNRHMMTLARESRGITQSGLAKLLSAGQGTVSKYESGVASANESFVSELANALSYEPEFFYLTGRPYGMPPFHYRKRKKLGKKALEKMIAEMNIRRIHLKILLNSYELKSSAHIPEIDRDMYVGQTKKSMTIEDVARQVRELWALPEGPIDNVIELLEYSGGVVLPCNFESDLIDAVSQRVDGMPVMFFVNMNAPSDRIRWTLCHELGHMVLHTTSIMDDEAMEIEADDFAGAFSLPAHSIRPHLKTFSLRQVANMKRHWKMSMSAIAMRAEKLGFITPHQKKYFFIEMGKLGYRKNEPCQPEMEYPKTLRRIINYHINNLGYSEQELARALFVSVDELRRMYPDDRDERPKRPNLTVVK